MKMGFEKHWKQDYQKGLAIANTSSPNADSIVSFNSIVAIAHALDTMFLRMKPAVYAQSPVRLYGSSCVSI